MTPIDERVRFFMERRMGIDPASFPRGGTAVRLSWRRKDIPWKRLSIVRIGDGAVATTIPRLIRAVAPLSVRLSAAELFSSDGLCELHKALLPHGIKDLREGYHFTAADKRRLEAHACAEPPVKVLENDGPPSNGLSPYPRLLPPVHHFVAAFAVCRDHRRVARAGIRWHSSDLIEIGVESDEAYRRRGFGTAVVAAAARWVLDQGAVVYYRVFPSNVPSVRIARRLGFDLTWQEIYA